MKFPNIDDSSRKWIVNDLKMREDRLRSDLHLHNTIEQRYTEERISLIAEAREIMLHKNSVNWDIVKKVYEPFLK